MRSLLKLNQHHPSHPRQFASEFCYTRASLFYFRFTIYFTQVSAPNIETIVSLAKRRGFVYPSSEIYGGLGSAWDYGPLGVEIANNVRQAWWRWMVYERDDIEGLDSSIILNRLVWKYSGHEDTFSDPLVDCKECNTRLRADKLDDRKCPNCGSSSLTEPRPFN